MYFVILVNVKKYTFDSPSNVTSKSKSNDLIGIYPACTMLGGLSLLFSIFLLFLLYMIYTVGSLLYYRSFYTGIPSPPLDNFWHGHQLTLYATKLDNTFLSLFDRWTRKYGKTIMVFATFRNILFTVDREMIKLVTTDLNNFIKMDDLPNRSLYGQRIVGWNSILTGGGRNWAIKRKVMSKFFSKANMTDVFELCKPMMVNYVRTTMAQKVGTGAQLELHEEFSTIFEAFPAAVGLSGYEEPEVIGRYINQILDVIPKQLGNHFTLNKILFAIANDKHVTVELLIQMRLKLRTLVAEKTQDMKSVDAEPAATDMFGHLIKANEACDFDPDELEELIVEDIMTVYLVMDNMVKQLSSLFIFLEEERHRHVYHKMVEEIRGFTLTDYNSLNQLPYTERVLLESLRLAPALLRGTRLFQPADKNNKVLKHWSVPHGTQTHFSLYLVQNSDEFWDNPTELDPERWKEGFTPEPYTYLPFLAGPRGCLGKHFAMLTMKLALVTLLQKFDFQPRFNEKKKPEFDQGLAVMRIRGKVNYEVTPVP